MVPIKSCGYAVRLTHCQALAKLREDLELASTSYSVTDQRESKISGHCNVVASLPAFFS